ncbi:cytochrome P450 [Antrihabitans cavernicola]|uniref:Cytochrome P450 n=1 Tax=Antrihabitans cavernicola TaxID=2495913 RepID=A0A5A7S910_9NOCA|nr:cytochrome P450 [Spelaeibacter cavernicola]KAA0022620.1 cytochrome P450 [Spelaeibacter cavernicola]
MAVESTADKTKPRQATIQLRDLPRPPIHSAVGFAAFWADPEFARKQFDVRGDRMVVDLPLLPTMLFTAVPEDAKAVFTQVDSGLRLGEALRRLAPHEMLFGREMIDWWNGANHAKLRKKVAPAFNGAALRGYEEAMVDAAKRRVDEWPVGEPVRFTRQMKTLARDVIMSVVFGVTEGDRRDRLEQALIDLDRAIASNGMRTRYVAAILSGGRWPRYTAMREISARIDAVTLEEIAFRRANPSPVQRKDCLAIFLELAEDDPENLLSDQMIAVFQRMLLIAGYETTAVTLAWVAERLVRHPEVMATLDQSLAAGADDYLDAVITETMRIRPALPVTMRYAEKDVDINGLRVPKGTIVMLYINAIQKREEFYPNPDEFDPDRFLGVRPDPHRWLPFGGGAHRCLAANFAMFESRVLLRTILTHRRLLPDAGAGERQDQHRNILLTPHRGATVTLAHR